MERNDPFDGDGPSDIYPHRPFDPRRPFPPHPNGTPTVDMYEVDCVNGSDDSLECIVTFDPSQGSEQAATRVVQERLNLRGGHIDSVDYLGQYQLGSNNYNAQIQRVDHVIHNHSGQTPSPPNWDDPPIFWY